MKSIHPRQIFLATACIFGAINLATMSPTTAQNSPSTPDNQLPPVSPTTPNSPTTPSSSPQTPNTSTPTYPTQTTSPTPTTTPRNTTNMRGKTSPRSKPGRNTPAGTTSPTPTSPKQSEKSVSVSAVDRQFAIKAAQSDMTEIQTSQLALNRSQNPQVLKYAQEMIQAHTDSTSKLKPIAARLNLAMPKTLGADNQVLVDRLSRLSNTQFDMTYTTGQARAHAQTQSLFQNEVQQGKNPELKAFANEILPVVSMHLQMAKSLTAMR
jgi:putative membrane protein